ncbi:hypothetical protein L3V83_11545 [Thiotrichales bacterium 19X7-9]|nr:hypothetical protein [Thiotrichales bacterium 19X7-9]
MNIIDAMQALEYPSDKVGVCYGIAYMGIQAVLRKDFETFMNRIKKIHDIKDKNTFINSVNDAESKRAKKLSLTDGEKLLCSIKPFFDGISIYHGPSALDERSKDVMHNLLPLINCQDYTIANEILNSSIGDLGSAPIFSKSKELKIFTQKSLEKYLEDKRSNEDDKIPFVCSLNCGNHTISVGYLNNKWVYINHDNIVHSRSLNLERLAKSIMQAMHQNSKQIIVYIESYSSEKPTKVEVGGMDLNTVKLLQVYNSIQVGLLFLALQYGHYQAVAAYMTGINDSELSDTQKVELFTARNNDGIPGLLLALLNGHNQAVAEYMKGINDSGLSDIQKVGLFTARDNDGIPGLLLALQNGHDQAVAEYMTGINDSKLSNTQKTKIFAAEKNNEVSGLFMALQNGHDQAVAEYMNGINGSGLSNIQKARLFTARRNDGILGLLVALEKNHTNSVKSYLEAISQPAVLLKQVVDTLFVNKQLKNRLIGFVVDNKSYFENNSDATASVKEILKKERWIIHSRGTQGTESIKLLKNSCPSLFSSTNFSTNNGIFPKCGVNYYP